MESKGTASVNTVPLALLEVLHLARPLQILAPHRAGSQGFLCEDHVTARQFYR